MLRLNVVRLRTLGYALILGSFIFTTFAFAKTGDNKTIEIFPSGFAIRSARRIGHRRVRDGSRGNSQARPKPAALQCSE